MRDDERVFQITAPYFTAGIATRGDRCTEAAPILRWAIGKTRGDLSHYFMQRGWRVEQVSGKRTKGKMVL